MARLGQILMYVGFSVILTSVMVTRVRVRRSKRREGTTRNEPMWLRSGLNYGRGGLGVLSGYESGRLKRPLGKDIIQGSSSEKQTLQRGTVAKFQPTKEDEFFLRKIGWYSNALDQAWNDPVQLDAARRVVPMEIKKMIYDSQHTKRPSDGSAPEYDAIKALMTWFRTEFMQWVKRPSCERKNCKGIIPDRCEDDDYMVPPRINQTTNIPFDWSGYRVDIYKCSGCNQIIKFPRYNDPERLLKYHSGRCGEHSCLFTFICFALGIDARLLSCKVFDHAWLEVYIKSINRWVHCDPSEEQLDTPLMFELGWFEKIDTVIAFSTEEVLDVTPRYTHDYRMTKSQRTIPDHILQKHITAAHEKRQKNLQGSRLKELRRREEQEKVELTSPINMDILHSVRISSSLEWKKRNGKVLPDVLEENGFIWEFNEEEMNRKAFHLSYSCLADEYVRHNTGRNQIVKKWNKGVRSAESIQRIMEEGSKMCYLTRLEEAPKSSISWKFQFPKEIKHLKIDQVKITMPTEQLALNGYITITVFSRNHFHLLQPVYKDGSLIYETLETNKFRGESSIWIKIVMASGNWDTTQLFISYQGRKKDLDVVVTFYKSSPGNSNVQTTKTWIPNV